MTLDEKIGLLHGPMGLSWTSREGVLHPAPAAAVPGAGYVPGLPRLGIPALYETDASLGVGNPGGVRPGDVATALPSSLALAAAFDPELSYRAGALVGAEARAKGFNVLLGGGVNLTRDPRNGRNFEYLGEDPLLAGTLAGEAVRGTQDQHVISTVKHFALNAHETNRWSLDARIDRAALRESDLLAFEIAIERGQPGAVMCAYNLVNHEQACGNHWLLDDVLKGDWQYPGWVMSDWGAVHATLDAANGLDQESGDLLDHAVYLGAPLEAAVLSGVVPAAHIDEMVRRILRSMFAVGIVDRPHPDDVIDYRGHAELAREIAQKGLVLLKNADGLLPLDPRPLRIAVIGGHADAGVLSGGGSAQVIPANGKVTDDHRSAPAIDCFGQIFDPSAPLDALRRLRPQDTVTYDSGSFPARAAVQAAKADIAIVFVTRFEREGQDIPDLALPDGQDALIEAVASANPHTVVVLETGNPVAMPWLERVSAVLESWYPGQEGGRAVADVLTGAVNPSGRLPITFPRDVRESVRPTLPNGDSDPGASVHVDYIEGADVGYRWYSRHGVRPLFPFGFGLTYTRFEYGDVRVSGGARLTVSFEVYNAGERAGADSPQVYLVSAAGKQMLRLIGFERVYLKPGEKRRVIITADRRLLGGFDERHARWRVDRGTYRVLVGKSAGELQTGGETVIAAYHGK